MNRHRQLMSLLSAAAGLALFAGSVTTAHAVPVKQPAAVQSQAVSAAALLEDVQSYTIYYGEPSERAVKQLSRHDLVVLEPRLWSEAQLRLLQDRGVRVYGYLSLLEQHETSALHALAEPADYLWIEGERDWRSEWRSWSMNINSENYRELLRQDYRSQILDKGLDGVFLDTAGNVDDGIWNAAVSDSQRDGVVSFIRELRAAHPAKGIIQNWGLGALKDRTAPDLDGILWENFSPQTAAQDEWCQNRIAELNLLRGEGLTVFTANIGLAGRDKARFDAWNEQLGYVGAVIADGYDHL